VEVEKNSKNVIIHNMSKINSEKIRKATPKDIGQLIEIKPSLTQGLIISRLNKQHLKQLEYLVLERDGKIVSFLLLKWNGKKSHPEYPDIEDLNTLKTERQKGLGTKLVQRCEQLVRSRGFNKIGLAVNPNLNKNAYHLYKNLGYRHDNLKSYVDGVYNGVKDFVIDLEKDL